jgi:hypothetical protein
MSNTHHKSAASVNRGPLAGRIAGAAVAAALFLGAPLLTSMAVAPGVAVADDGLGGLPNIDFSFLDKCAKPYDNKDCDQDGISNLEETRLHTDPTDPKSFPFEWKPTGGNFNFGF